MTINELINALYNIEDLNAEILRLEFNENASELTLVIAKDENWEEEYKINANGSRLYISNANLLGN